MSGTLHDADGDRQPARTGRRRLGRETRPLRRASDPTLLLGPARPLSIAGAGSVAVGVALASTGAPTVAPVAFVLSTVLGVGLFASARRSDTAMRHDLNPDRSTRTRRVLVVALGLALLGGVWSAWTMTEPWTDLGPRATAAGTAEVVWHAVFTGFLTLAGVMLPVLAVWILDWARARFRPPKPMVCADLEVAVYTDGTLWRAEGLAPLLVGNDLFEPAGVPRSRHFQWRGLAFDVHNPPGPLRPPIGIVGSPEGPTAASRGVLEIDGGRVGRVPMGLRDTWIFVLSPERTRGAASDPTSPDFRAAYGRLVLLRARADAGPVDLANLPALAHHLARAERSATVESGSVEEMLEFVSSNVSAPRDLPRLTHSTPGVAPPETESSPFAALERFADLDDDAFDPDTLGSVSDPADGRDPPPG